MEIYNEETQSKLLPVDDVNTTFFLWSQNVSSVGGLHVRTGFVKILKRDSSSLMGIGTHRLVDPVKIMIYPATRQDQLTLQQSLC